MFLEGHLYYSQNYLCFFANFLGRERKVCIFSFARFYSQSIQLVISWADVLKLDRRSTGKVIPNAILVTTTSGVHLFRNFINRHEAFVVAEKLWHKKKLNVAVSSYFPVSALSNPPDHTLVRRGGKISSKRKLV